MEVRSNNHGYDRGFDTKQGENMIIWIDGANGVGKSHVAAKLEELLTDRNAEYVESDIYWRDLLQNNFLKALAGFNPYCNKYFLELLRKALEEKMYDSGKVPIVPMSLVDQLCEKELLDYFDNKGVPMIHIILEAKKDTIISRIENDPIRDKSAENQQISKVAWQIQYLEKEYPDAVRINTECKSLDEVVEEIRHML